MCGLAGLVHDDPRRSSSQREREEVALMLAALAHRGPDGEGIVCRQGAALGHRRLAIIDLTQRAAQPMPLRCREAEGEPAAWVVLNGEIYNYVELRAELTAAGHRFHSDSDTEVILHLYEEEGDDCPVRMRGMFAFALWDVVRGRLLLARDRMGKKPLYYRQGLDHLAFASEIKALAAHARHRHESFDTDDGALMRYLSLKYIPGPQTAIQNVFRLPAGHVMTYERGQASLRSYWSLPRAAEKEQRDGRAPQEWHEELRSCLREAVRIRLRSDVPLGLFLSGGLDSGIIASTMADLAPGRVKTFSVGFAEKDYDELEAAALVARRFSTEHHEIRISPTPQSTVELLPRLARQMDQPFADSSALAMYHLAREVRRHVTVALSGDGADELFLGYDRYRAHRIADSVAQLPGTRGPLARGLVRALLPRAATRRNLAGRARRFIAAAGLGALDRNDGWISILDRPRAESLLTAEFLSAAAGAAGNPLSPLRRCYEGAAGGDPLLAIQRADLLVYLPDDILHKVDAATMAHALEARAPFLDHHVVELAMRIPAGLKLPGKAPKMGKAILRDAFSGCLPSETIHGRKAGFGLPLDHWLRKDLSGYCRDILLSSRALSRGIVRKEGVEALMAEHVSGRENREDLLWALLMLEHWFREHVDAVHPEERAASAAVAASPR